MLQWWWFRQTEQQQQRQEQQQQMGKWATMNREKTNPFDHFCVWMTLLFLGWTLRKVFSCLDWTHSSFMQYYLIGFIVLIFEPKNIIIQWPRRIWSGLISTYFFSLYGSIWILDTKRQSDFGSHLNIQSEVKRTIDRRSVTQIEL